MVVIIIKLQSKLAICYLLSLYLCYCSQMDEDFIVMIPQIFTLPDFIRFDGSVFHETAGYPFHSFNV